MDGCMIVYSRIIRDIYLIRDGDEDEGLGDFILFLGGWVGWDGVLLDGWMDGWMDVLYVAFDIQYILHTRLWNHISIIGWEC